jgi:hypothetical protein
VQRKIVGLLSGYSEDNHDVRLIEPILTLLISPDPIIAGRAFDVLEGFITDICRTCWFCCCNAVA